MKAVGGYFELELPASQEYHLGAVRLNTGRNSFEYILRAKEYEKVYLPYYTCDVMLEVIQKLDLKVDFYTIDETFRPVFNFSCLGATDVFVYNNYFGICDVQVAEVAEKCKNLIIDNSQAFFSMPLPGVDTFYSPRKFFGVPDGGYLYTNQILSRKLEQDVSYTRFTHLIKRIDIGSEAGYEDFKKNDGGFSDQPIKLMSELTQRLLGSLDYPSIAQKRRQNFTYLHSQLGSKNRLDLNPTNESIPMVYPYLTSNGGKIKEKLNALKIFVATYWPNVVERCEKDSVEFEVASNTLFLPIDQRYGLDEIIYIYENISHLTL